MAKDNPGRIATISRWLTATLSVYLTLFRLPASANAIEDHVVDRAVVNALKFLASEQHPNGSWEAEQGNQSTAATSLAVMAFLAAGHVPGEGPYGLAIDRGVAFVLSHQEGNGMLVNRRGHGPMYEHGISTLMLAEVSGMTNQDLAARTKKGLEKAVRLILLAQDARKPKNEAGGWRYQHSSRDSDLSVTAWQMLALRAAKDIGCDVPVESINRAVDYVKKCADQRGFGYQPGQSSRATMTAAGVLALQVCDHQDDNEVARGIEFVKRHPLRLNDGWFFYGAYYNAISTYKFGGEDWELTKADLFEILCANQKPTGGWYAGNPLEAGQGPIYATSLSVLALTVEYGYLPIYQR
jgi:hypothetical protein